MRTVASPICFLTGAISRSNSSPSESSTTSGRRASGSPSVVLGNSSMSVCPCELWSCMATYPSRAGAPARTPASSFAGTARAFASCKAAIRSAMNCGIILHPADQGRAARVLPGETEEVETRDVGHPATVSQSPVGVKDRKVDPGVVGPVARRPDDRVDFDLASVLETRLCARRRLSRAASARRRSGA